MSQAKQSFWQPEMLVAISAVVIGVCALGVSLYEAHLMRVEQRASVIPMIELSRSFYRSGGDDAPLRLELQAENVGIGPARIRYFNVTVDGQSQPNWNSAIQALLGREEAVDFGTSTINGRTIPPDRSVTMFQLVDTDIGTELYRAFDRLDFTACYCSIFDECWTTGYQAGFGSVSEVPSCDTDQQVFDD